MFLASWLFIFHGCVLLFAPNRYLPLGAWGESTIVLVRKPPYYFGRRLIGLCLSVAVFCIFTIGGLHLMLQSQAAEISSGTSPLPPGSVRWDMLGFGLFAVVSGGLMLYKPRRSVEVMFTSEPEKLKDPTTRKLWELHVRLAGAFCWAFSLLAMNDFFKSLR